MAINNNTNNKIEEDNIIFAVQGAKSFLKCKMDWVGIGKLHVSFVSHTGLENGCKQLGHIEAALPFDGEDGALALGKMILRGDLDKVAPAQSRRQRKREPSTRNRYSPITEAAKRKQTAPLCGVRSRLRPARRAISCFR